MKEDTASWVSSFQGLRGRVLKWENAWRRKYCTPLVFQYIILPNK